jgi:Superinfection immunity protein/zinc-ribbon domain
MFHFGFPFFLASVALYFLPTIIGSTRQKTNLMGIFLVNVFLGWSVIGWIIALVWAVSTERIDQIPYARRAPVPEPQGRFCPSCGSVWQGGTQFCAHCGQRLA